MNLKQKLELIKRNTEEIVTEAELKSLLKKKKQPVAYCGYEPSGPMHLGHFVTILKLNDLQKAGFKVKVLLADVHAFLNKKGAKRAIKKEAERWKRIIKAIRMEADAVLGSSFEYNKKYVEDVMMLTYDVTINRGLRSMQEIARDFKNPTISQLWYPLMQVADIKHLKVDVAVGGMEQRKVHMIGREVASKLGYNFISLHTPLITSLKGPGTKMSSSVPGSIISVLDSKKDIEKKIKKAHCPARKIEDNPIIQIAKLIIFPMLGNLKIERDKKFGRTVVYADCKSLEKDFRSGKLHPLDLKNSVAKSLNDIIKPIRKKYRK